MTDTEQTTPATQHCGYVALVGAPNAGKSTLLNRLVGAKVSIVSKKVQTTRARITAIAVEGDVQIVFLDTPGIFVPKRRLDRAMVTAAWSGIDDADAVLLLIDAGKGYDDESRAIVEALKARKRKVLLALNKIDTVAREKLLGLAKMLNDDYPFEQTFMISAEKGHGVDDVRTALAKRMPAGPWLYPEDQLADVPMRFLAAEITREQVYRSLHDELPYAITVETENWTDQKKGGAARIEQVIYVERDSQKKIVLGQGGQMIKRIGAKAREEMQVQFDRPVHLFLFVKVREDWGDDPERYEAMGLDFPKK
ncbi:GTPase Era [Ferrovibrio xuzhouensis]|uniref:GTPase Era n=1 Tax=Ferrovibrio xuzhouensis TaxID=1576914 RepID=A0ABV7VJ41_9PROT